MGWKQCKTGLNMPLSDCMPQTQLQHFKNKNISLICNLYSISRCSQDASQMLGSCWPSRHPTAPSSDNIQLPRFLQNQMVNLSRAILPLEFSFWDPRHHHASPVKCYLIDVNLMLFTFFFGCSSMFQLAAGHLFSTKAALTCSGAHSTPNPTLAPAK